MAGGVHAWQGDMRGGGHSWWGACLTGGVHGRRGMCGRGVCMVGRGVRGRYYEIWSMSGRYASYWNALLFQVNLFRIDLDIDNCVQ